ncbi:hypothetical protein CVV38_04455 [Candidatus Peregrinibacteria bacterium HGW-Peregrinibacteria-1]|jgi:hypothetical protein|nr:MAG: hypothetical protein CVV38_04455 [Candidatus Peregrinibacteria bacterium HGW-Peregrinibacteria-1]
MKKLLTLLSFALLISACNGNLNDIDDVREEGSDSEEEIIVENSVVPAGYKEVMEENFSFYYPENYTLNDGIVKDTIFSKTFYLTDAQYDNWDNIEGPPGIHVSIAEKPENMDLESFLSENSNSTNYDNGLSGEVSYTESENGYQVLNYGGDGLYTYEYHVLESGSSVYIVSGWANEDNAMEFRDALEIANSLKFNQ